GGNGSNVPAAGNTDTVDRTATPVSIGRLSASKRAGRHSVRFTVSCPAGEAGGCTGELRLTTASAVSLGGVKVRALLGTAKFSLKSGERKTLTIKLPAGVQRLAGKGRTLRMSVAATARDAAGNAADSGAQRSVRLAR
ncbi:MAG: hypothetical protein JHC95_18390, partial [Solirubrobacteraceae bacterium]|nr:hypothetical protein [Solirubrobacteraceae bacterium]